VCRVVRRQGRQNDHHRTDWLNLKIFSLVSEAIDPPLSEAVPQKRHKMHPLRGAIEGDKRAKMA
jgi:hypothetical protein